MAGESVASNQSPSSFGEMLAVPELPSAIDKLFVSKGDLSNTACLNWLPDKWDLYATGYKDAADVLVAYVENYSRRHDTLVYPIFFLYRQYLELAIKDLLRDVLRLQDKQDSVPVTHNIDHLWRICHKLLVEIAPDNSDESLRHVGRLISEFSKVDPTSMAFRYPVDKEGNPTLQGLTHVNLRNAKDVIDKVSVLLGGAACMVGEYLSCKHEMEQEYRSEYW